ncbi:phosphodiester glycosidase family protein [Limibacter armeniacum]|uniref:phosphodiester glycosidase family protein n=1 Tax=Limibacter armeniacum TaxID=466084 RepID=UPI002FE61130
MRNFYHLTRIFLVCILALASSQLFAQEPEPAINWQWTRKTDLHLPKGIQVYETSSTLPDGSPNHAVYTVLDRTANPNLGLKTVYGGGLKTPLERYQESQSGLEKAFVAVNGGFFGGTSSVSLVVNDSERLSVGLGGVTRPDAAGNNVTAYPIRAAFGIEQDGSPAVTWTYDVADGTGGKVTYAFPEPGDNNEYEYVFGPQPTMDNLPAEAAIWTPEMAIGAGPMLITDGAINVTDAEEFFGEASGVGVDVRHPRTAIGYTADGKVILLVVDGRQAGFATGVTMPELAAVMESLGAMGAINLDGGGSSSMVADGKAITSPSDAVGMRAVASVVMICTEPQIYDTENTAVFSTSAGWSSTAQAGWYGTSNSLIAPTVDPSLSPDKTATYTLPAEFQAAEYVLEGAWASSGFPWRSNATPYAVVRAGMEDEVYYADQSKSPDRFNQLGTVHLGPGDKVIIGNNAPGNYVTVDAIRLTKVGESVPVVAVAEGNGGSFLNDSEVALTINFTSPNTGVTASQLRVFNSINGKAEEEILVDDLSGREATYNFAHTLVTLGENRFRFEAEDNLGRKVSATFIAVSRSFDIALENGETGKHQTQHMLSVPVRMDASNLSGINLSKLEVFEIKGIDTVNVLSETLTQAVEEYTFNQQVKAPAKSKLKYLFRATASNGDMAEIMYQAEVIPARGSTRLAVISDMNGSYGATDYEWQVDSIMQRIPRIWNPDMVVCGGDMVAGQSASLTQEEVKAMWAGFDQDVFSPLRDATIPFAFTLGNHDGTVGFQMEQDEAAAYWNTPGNHPGWEPINEERYPFFSTFRIPGNSDLFFLSWDASKASFTAEELAWVETQLQSSEAQNAKMRFVIGHIPLYAVAAERNGTGNTLVNPEEIRALLEQYDVHTYISGHHHAYYPAKRGNIDLLNAGAIGSGPRQLLNSTLAPTNTVTLMDIFHAADSENVYGVDTVIYTTFETQYQLAEDMPLLEEKTLPEALISYNGYVVRRDIPMHGDASAQLSALNISRNVISKGNGEVDIHLHNGTLEISGSFNNLLGKLSEADDAVALYFGLHGDESGEALTNFTVTTADQKNGTFTAVIQENVADLVEQMNMGMLYVMLKTDQYPNGEIRGQIYPLRNTAPEMATITSHQTEEVYPVRDVEAIFNVEWSAATDAEHNNVTYFYQLAKDADFQEIVWEGSAGKKTAYSLKTEKNFYTLLTDMGATEGVAVTFYHRVIVTDGKHIEKGASHVLKVALSNEPIDGFVNTLAPDYQYKQQTGITSAANGHGVAVDGNGRIWSVSYSAGIMVHNPDGTIHKFDGATYSDDYISSVMLPNGSSLSAVYNRGLGTDIDGNILVSMNNSNLVKVDANTGTVLRHYNLGTSLTNPSMDATGRIFLASVVGNSQFLLKESGADTYEVIKQFEVAERPSVVRAAAITKDGSRIILPPHSGQKANVYRAIDTDKLIFDQAEEIAFENSGASSNSVASVMGSRVFVLVNKAKIGAQLIFRDYQKQLGWTLELPDVATSDIRGIALDQAEGKFYLVSSADGSVSEWAVPASISFGKLNFKYNGKQAMPEVMTEPASLSPVITFNGNEELPVNAGQYTVVAQTFEAGYEMNAEAVMTIEKASLTVHVPDLTLSEGEAMPQNLIVIYEGFVNGEDESSLQGALLFSTVGDSMVTASGLESRNYEINYLPGELTIEAVTGIDDLVNGQPVLMYPNPVTDQVKVKANTKGILKISVFSATGRLEYQVMAENDKPFSLEHLSQGLYYMKIKVDESTIVRKLIKL